MKPRSLRRAVIKEEFVALTGNCEQAIILNQFDYWSHRTNDIDAYIEEEIARQQNPEAIDILEKTKTNGWIYKSTKELLGEIMLSISEKTARRHLIKLVEHRWLQERDNPDNKWDKRKQYRYNLAKVQKDLSELNYPLEGWQIISEQFDASKRHGDEWEGHSDASKVHSDASETPRKPTPVVVPTLAENRPEITTENTTENKGPSDFYEKNLGPGQDVNEIEIEDSTRPNRVVGVGPRKRLKGKNLQAFELVADNLRNTKVSELERWCKNDSERVLAAYRETLKYKVDNYNYFAVIYDDIPKKTVQKTKGTVIDYDAVDSELYGGNKV